MEAIQQYIRNCIKNQILRGKENQDNKKYSLNKIIEVKVERNEKLKILIYQSKNVEENQRRVLDRFLLYYLKSFKVLFFFF